MSLPSSNEHTTLRMENKTLKARIELLEEEKAHGIAQQKKWQKLYFDLKERYESEFGKNVDTT
jgi:regulator of replication initiation timing